MGRNNYVWFYFLVLLKSGSTGLAKSGIIFLGEKAYG
jgi:hypothetical protein